MRQTKIIIVIFMGVLALSAAMTACASAYSPEFEVTTNFKTGGESPVLLETTAGAKISCSRAQSNGEATFRAGAFKSANGLVLDLLKCKFGAVECQNQGALTEEIRTKTLEGVLGYIEPGKLGAASVAFALQPEGAGPIAAFKCGTESPELKGCVLGTLGPTNSLTNLFTLELEQTGGVQSYNTYEFELLGKKGGCNLSIEEGGRTIGAGLRMKQSVIPVPCPNMENIKD